MKHNGCFFILVFSQKKPTSEQKVSPSNFLLLEIHQTSKKKKKRLCYMAIKVKNHTFPDSFLKCTNIKRIPCVLWSFPAWFLQSERRHLIMENQGKRRGRGFNLIQGRACWIIHTHAAFREKRLLVWKQNSTEKCRKHVTVLLTTETDEAEQV